MLTTRLFGGVRGSGTEDMVDPEQARQSNAIVIGHGRFGQAVAQIFAGASISVTLIDINPDQIRLSGEFGRKVFYGDGTRIDLLRRAGAEGAGALLFCMDDKNFGPDQIAPIAHAFPDAKIFVRANDRRQLLALKHAPIAAAQRELFESSVKLAHTALLRTGIDPVVADRVVEEFRRRDCERLELQMEAGSMRAGMHLSFGAVDSEAFDPQALDPQAEQA